MKRAVGIIDVGKLKLECLKWNWDELSWKVQLKLERLIEVWKFNRKKVDNAKNNLMRLEQKL